MRRWLAALAAVMALGTSPASQVDPWVPLRFLAGNWTGSTLTQPVAGTSERTYSFVLADAFMQERTRTMYEPRQRNGPRETEEKWSLFGFDRSRGLLTARRYHQDGYVITYFLDASASTPTRLVFQSESLANFAPNWRAREIYEIVSEDEFIETFEVAEVGKDYEVHSQTRFTRVR